MSSQKFGVVENRVSAYRREAEGWKSDHDLAMRCMDFESLLQSGLSSLEAIHSIDEKWRLGVRSGKTQYDSEDEQAITSLYECWSSPRERVSRELVEFETAGFVVEYASDFRAACREVAGILTDDREFFKGDALISSCDNAIDAHGENKCERWQAS